MTRAIAMATILAMAPLPVAAQVPEGNGQPQYPGYPPSQAPQAAQAPQAPAAAPLARLRLATESAQAAQLTWACADALDNRHLAAARTRCGEALAHDPSIALTRLFLAEAEPPEMAAAQLSQAVPLSRRRPGLERLWFDAVQAQRAWRHDEARRLFDLLAERLPGEPRVFLARGRFRLEQLRDADGALADFRQAAQLDPKYAATEGYLAAALAERGQLDEALVAAKNYLELAPSEPNAQVVLARLLLSKGELAPAITSARAAVAADDAFAPAHAALGDALLFAGKYGDARKEYARLIGGEEASVHHDGAMREARSWVFESRSAQAERALTVEADLAQKTHRPGDQVDALLELARIELDRGATADAGQTLRGVGEILAQEAATAPERFGEQDRNQVQIELYVVRAMVLAAVGERALAESRADEMVNALKLALDPRAEDQATALKGWIAARNHDDRTALAELQLATRPSLRMALALAAQRSGDLAHARQIMEALARRMENDLETALTRPRAIAWLKQQPPASAK